jgi:hypothetical protein|tara:strand:- start:42 stop:506 length:465 start_codon:yes stop_codon:yes gene_type:complete
MTVHRKTPMPKTAVKKTVQGAYGSTKTKTYQKPLIGKTTTAGRNLTKKRALASALKKKLPYVGTALTALSIGKKIVKIVKAKKAMVPMKGSKNYKAPKKVDPNRNRDSSDFTFKNNDPFTRAKKELSPLRTPYPSLRNQWVDKTLSKLRKVKKK